MKHDQPKHSNVDHAETDAFDHFLMTRLQKSQPYLADDDFTARVMESLPAQRKLSRWQERLIILVPLFIISALVLSQFSVLAVVIEVWTLMMGLNVVQLIQLGVVMS
ncbi:MAG: hypothetical protein ABW044_13400, partial [Cellvibrio sp.]